MGNLRVSFPFVAGSGWPLDSSSTGEMQYPTVGVTGSSLRDDAVRDSR